MERSGRDNGGAVGDGVVRETTGRIANEDLLLEEDAEPFGGVFVGVREGEGARGNFATVAGDRESGAAEVRGVGGADKMDNGSALAIDPPAINGI